MATSPVYTACPIWYAATLNRPTGGWCHKHTEKMERQLIRKLFPSGKKQFLASVLDYSGANRLLRHWNSWSGLLVLNYHRIGDPLSCEFDRNLFSASQENFEKQVRLFQSCADLITTDDLQTVLKANRGKHILITFDDGYRDNYELAFPVLKSCNASALFFIATSFIDSPRFAWWSEIAWMIRNARVKSIPANKWFDAPLEIDEGYPSQAIGKAVRRYWNLRDDETDAYLSSLAQATKAGRCPASLAEDLRTNWEMIQEMYKAGMGFGGHTVNHPVLAQIPPSRQREEIAGCRDRLTEKLGTAPLCFGYPVGQAHMFTSETKQILQEEGFRFAFSFYGGYQIPSRQDWLDIPRCSVEYSMPQVILNSRLTIPQIFAKN